MIVTVSGVVSGQTVTVPGEDSNPKNLLIGGIWQTAEDQAINLAKAGHLDAEYVPTYYSRTKNPYAALDETTIPGKVLADVTTNEATGVDVAARVGDVLAADDATPHKGGILFSLIHLNPLQPGTFRSCTDPSTGIITWYWATELNGLTDELLNPSDAGIGDHYGTIFAHSGGARTAVTAMLYQGVTADRLVLIDPARGLESNTEYISEIQQLLDRGVDIEYYYYKAENFLKQPPASFAWRGGCISAKRFWRGGQKAQLK